MVAPGADAARLVTVGEASQILHVHPNTLRKWSDQGLISSYRVGHRRDRRFAVEDLLDFLRAPWPPVHSPLRRFPVYILEM